MKFSIRQTLWGSIQFYKTHFKSFWKQFWFPMSLAFLQTLAMPSATEYLHQKTINLGEFLVFSSLAFIPSWLIIRSLIPFLKGVSFSSFWGRPFDKKDWQYFLRSIVFCLIIGVIAVLLILPIIGCAVFIGIHSTQYGASIESIKFFASGAGAVVGIAFLMILPRLIFYPFSIYSDHPLTLKASWNLLDKNVLKFGFSFLIFSIALGSLPMVLIKLDYIPIYYVLTFFLFLSHPLWYIFFTSVFLTLSGKSYNVNKNPSPKPNTSGTKTFMIVVTGAILVGLILWAFDKGTQTTLSVSKKNPDPIKERAKPHEREPLFFKDRAKFFKANEAFEKGTEEGQKIAKTLFEELANDETASPDIRDASNVVTLTFKIDESGFTQEIYEKTKKLLENGHLKGEWLGTCSFYFIKSGILWYGYIEDFDGQAFRKILIDALTNANHREWEALLPVYRGFLDLWGIGLEKPDFFSARKIFEDILNNSTSPKHTRQLAEFFLASIDFREGNVTKDNIHHLESVYEKNLQNQQIPLLDQGTLKLHLAYMKEMSLENKEADPDKARELYLSLINENIQDSVYVSALLDLADLERHAPGRDDADFSAVKYYASKALESPEEYISETRKAQAHYFLGLSNTFGINPNIEDAYRHFEEAIKLPVQERTSEFPLMSYYFLGMIELKEHTDQKDHLKKARRFFNKVLEHKDYLSDDLIQRTKEHLNTIKSIEQKGQNT